jgi:16S rRNA (guanine527-N7)-methyltransferase
MPVLPEAEIVSLLNPYLSPLPNHLPPLLSGYLDLLVRWNARTNLTAIRSPEEMVRRHFGESLFAASHLGDPMPATLLDLGSGAGFPGIPTAILHPEVAVTLAESQNKKATFLREVSRTLGLRNVEVWAGRAEDLPRTFDTVALRAVDDMKVALAAATSLASRQLLILTTEVPEFTAPFILSDKVELPGSERGYLLRAIRG